MRQDTPAACAEILIARKALRQRITELAAEITRDYSGRPGPPLLIGVLKGSALFMADLARALELDAAVDFISISPYAEGGESGVVKIIKDLGEDVSGRDVLLVEDIVDTGLTLQYLRRSLGQRGARSLRVVTLLDKPARRIIPVDLEYKGFEIPDLFVIGYGLDFRGLYRNVPDIVAVKDLPRLADEPSLLVEPLFMDKALGGVSLAE